MLKASPGILQASRLLAPGNLSSALGLNLTGLGSWAITNSLNNRVYLPHPFLIDLFLLSFDHSSHRSLQLVLLMRFRASLG